MNTDSNSNQPFCRFDDSSIMVGLTTLPNGEEEDFIKEMNLFHDRYRTGLYEKFPPGEKDPEYLKKFYNPRYYELFGRFDLAVINVIDDFEFPTQSFSPLSRRWPSDRDLEGREIADPNMDKAGKRSFLHQVIIGPTPLIRSDDKDKTLNMASDTFLSENPLPLIGICQLKVNNALLLGSGTDYLRATIKTIHKFYRNYISEKQKNRQLKIIILESSSWHEICLLAFSDSFKTIFDYLFELREMDVGDMERLLLSDSKYHNDYNQFRNSEKFVQQVNPNSKGISGNHLFANSLTLPGFRWDILHNNGSPKTTPLPISDDDKGCMIPVSRFIVKPGHSLETKNNLKRDDVDYCIGRGGDFLCLPVLSKDKSAEEDFKYIVESLSSRELVRFFLDYLRPNNSDDSNSENRANPHDLNKNYIASKSFIIATGMKDFSKPIDESHTYFEKDLKSLAISMDEINLKVIDPLRKYRVSKIAAMRLRNAVSLFNEGIQDRLLFTHFLELKSYMHAIIDGLANELRFSFDNNLTFDSFVNPGILGVFIVKILAEEDRIDKYFAGKLPHELRKNLKIYYNKPPDKEDTTIKELFSRLNDILKRPLIFDDDKFKDVRPEVKDEYKTAHSKYSRDKKNSLYLNRELFDSFYGGYLIKRAFIDLIGVSVMLNKYVDSFITGWQNRFHLNWRMSEITDYNCEIKGGIQQIITAFDGAYKALSKALTGKSDVIALATGLDTISSNRRIIELNYYDIFQPEFFAARVAHEIGEQVLDDISSTPYIENLIADVKKMLPNHESDNSAFSDLKNLNIHHNMDNLGKLLSECKIKPPKLTAIFDNDLMSQIFAEYTDYMFTFFQNKELFIKWRRNLLLSNSITWRYKCETDEIALIPHAFLRYLARVLFIVTEENDSEIMIPENDNKEQNIIPDNHPLKHICKFSSEKERLKYERDTAILHNVILKLLKHNTCGLAEWKRSVEALLNIKFTQIWDYSLNQCETNGKIPDEITQRIERIKSSLSEGIVTPYLDNDEEYSDYKHVQFLMYSYLEYLDEISDENDEVPGEKVKTRRFDLFRDKEGVPMPDKHSANILFDTRSGTFVHKPKYRRAYLRSRFAFIYSLWDMNTKEKIKLIKGIQRAG